MKTTMMVMVLLMAAMSIFGQTNVLTAEQRAVRMEQAKAAMRASISNQLARAASLPRTTSTQLHVQQSSSADSSIVWIPPTHHYRAVLATNEILADWDDAYPLAQRVLSNHVADYTAKGDWGMLSNAVQNQAILESLNYNRTNAVH